MCINAEDPNTQCRASDTYCACKNNTGDNHYAVAHPYTLLQNGGVTRCTDASVATETCVCGTDLNDFHYTVCVKDDICQMAQKTCLPKCIMDNGFVPEPRQCYCAVGVICEYGQICDKEGGANMTAICLGGDETTTTTTTTTCDDSNTTTTTCDDDGT